MGGNASFTLQQDPDIADAVRISLDTKDPESIRSLSLPFLLMRDFELETAGGLPVFSIHNKATGEVTVLGLPMGAQVEPETQRIILTPETEGFGDLIIEKSHGEAADPYAYWFSRQRDLLTATEFVQFVENYLSRTLEGWKNSRFDRQTLTWETRGDDRGFNEKAAAALLTETHGTREYTALLERMEAAAERTGKDLSLVTAPAIGDIVVKADHQRQAMTLQRENLLSLIRREEQAVFQNPELFFLFTAGDENGPPAALKALAETAPTEGIDAATAAGMFAFYLACLEEEGQPWPEITRYAALPETVLLPAIKVTREGFFIAQEGVSNSVKLSLEVGALLVRSGELTGRTIHSTLGRELIHSALMLGDEQGYLPEEFFFEDGEIIFSGYLPPEEFYPLLSNRDSIPRSLSLYREMGPGRWLYSNAEKVAVERSERSERYLFTAPVGEAHYILFQGVEPGFRLRLLGINWNPDPIFQYYYAGWYYDEETRSLFVKIKHRQKEEEILISYPAPTAAVPTASTTEADQAEKGSRQR